VALAMAEVGKAAASMTGTGRWRWRWPATASATANDLSAAVLAAGVPTSANATAIATDACTTMQPAYRGRPPKHIR
jgi:hypothetical protein